MTGGGLVVRWDETFNRCWREEATTDLFEVLLNGSRELKTLHTAQDGFLTLVGVFEIKTPADSKLEAARGNPAVTQKVTSQREINSDQVPRSR